MTAIDEPSGAPSDAHLRIKCELTLPNDKAELPIIPEAVRALVGYIDVKGITTRNLQVVNGCRNVRYLRVQTRERDVSIYQYVSTLSHLVSLDVFYDGRAAYVDIGSIGMLPSCDRMENISIKAIGVYKNIGADLAHYKHLKELELWLDDISTEQICELTNIKDLRAFSLHLHRKYPLSRQAIACVGKWSQLENIDMEGCELESLEFVATLGSLKNITVRENNIGPSAIKAMLPYMTNIERLDIRYNPVPIECIELIKSQLPKCRVYPSDSSDFGYGRGTGKFL
ncbi:hypothetical protein HYR69_07595 [Candidatus Sumerlaeota bacterium]|nr:hypothetical protein [Candidatus Sumerlaeota bacterium]